MAAGELQSDSLFLGLTRPPMLFGVSYTFAALNGLASLISFIVTSKFIYLFVMLPALHAAAYLICLKEPRTIELLMVKMQKCNRCRNKMHHNGTNSYDYY